MFSNSPSGASGTAPLPPGCGPPLRGLPPEGDEGDAGVAGGDHGGGVADVEQVGRAAGLGGVDRPAAAARGTRPSRRVRSQGRRRCRRRRHRPWSARRRPARPAPPRRGSRPRCGRGCRGGVLVGTGDVRAAAERHVPQVIQRRRGNRQGRRGRRRPGGWWSTRRSAGRRSGAVEGDRGLVPIEHAPLDALVAAIDGDGGEGPQAAPARSPWPRRSGRTNRSSSQIPWRPVHVENVTNQTATPTTAPSPASARWAKTLGSGPNRAVVSIASVVSTASGSRSYRASSSMRWRIVGTSSGRAGRIIGRTFARRR